MASKARQKEFQGTVLRALKQLSVEEVDEVKDLLELDEDVLEKIELENIKTGKELAKELLKLVSAEDFDYLLGLLRGVKRTDLVELLVQYSSQSDEPSSSTSTSQSKQGTENDDNGDLEMKSWSKKLYELHSIHKFSEALDHDRAEQAKQLALFYNFTHNQMKMMDVSKSGGMTHHEEFLKQLTEKDIAIAEMEDVLRNLEMEQARKILYKIKIRANCTRFVEISPSDMQEFGNYLIESPTNPSLKTWRHVAPELLGVKEIDDISASLAANTPLSAGSYVMKNLMSMGITAKELLKKLKEINESERRNYWTNELQDVLKEVIYQEILIERKARVRADEEIRWKEELDIERKQKEDKNLKRNDEEIIREKQRDKELKMRIEKEEEEEKRRVRRELEAKREKEDEERKKAENLSPVVALPSRPPPLRPSPAVCARPPPVPQRPSSPPSPPQPSNNPAPRTSLKGKLLMETVPINEGTLPSRRSYHLCFHDADAPCGERIFITWGCTGTTYHSGLHTYYTYIGKSTAVWSRENIKGKKPLGTYGAGGWYRNGKVVIVGGYHHTSGYSNDVYQLTFGSWKWSVRDTVGPKPSPRAFFAWWKYSNTFLLFGGQGPTPTDLLPGEEVDEFESGGSYNNQLFSLEYLNPPKWSHVATTGVPPSPRRYAGFTTIGTVGYLFGGRSEKQGHLNDLFTLDFVSKTWTPVQCSGDIPSPRSNCAMGVLGGKLFLCGGADREKILDECYSFDPNLKEWEKLKVANFQPRRGHTVTNVNDKKVVIFGGQDRNKKCTNTFWSVCLEE